VSAEGEGEKVHLTSIGPRQERVDVENALK